MSSGRVKTWNRDFLIKNQTTLHTQLTHIHTCTHTHIFLHLPYHPPLLLASASSPLFISRNGIPCDESVNMGLPVLWPWIILIMHSRTRKKITLPLLILTKMNDWKKKRYTSPAREGFMSEVVYCTMKTNSPKLKQTSTFLILTRFLKSKYSNFRFYSTVIWPYVKSYLWTGPTDPSQLIKKKKKQK